MLINYSNNYPKIFNDYKPCNSLLGKNAEIVRYFNGLEARTKMPLNTKDAGAIRRLF